MSGLPGSPMPPPTANSAPNRVAVLSNTRARISLSVITPFCWAVIWSQVTTKLPSSSMATAGLRSTLPGPAPVPGIPVVLTSISEPIRSPRRLYLCARTSLK